VTLLRVEDLAIAYRDPMGGERRAVDGVSFELARGGALGIVGESGCGKSTLARALLAHGRPGSRFAAGRILLDGTDILALAPAARTRLRGRRVALVPQNPLQALTPHLTIGAQLAEVLARHRGLRGAALRAATLDLLTAMQIADPETLAARYPHEASGGQRQRAVIAAAVAGEPDLLVLDEPTTALDKSTEAQVLALVQAQQARTGCALVYVSHDLRTIAATCREILVMQAGRAVEHGPAEAVLERPRAAYTRSLVGALPQLAPRPARPAPPPLLKAASLGFRYAGPRRWPFLPRRPGPAALDAVGFALAPGRTLGVVGESGSGKSTLGGLVAGLLAGHAGALHFEGAPLGGAARHRPVALRRRIQMIFQDPAASLNPRHRVLGLVARAFAAYHGLDERAARARAAALLARIGIGEELLRRLPGELSGGQQQRVAIARAFAAEPDLVVCDEITSALDVTIQAQVLALMRELQQASGVAYLFISHDLAVVSEMSDDILVLHQGRIRALGPAAQVLGAPADDYTRALIAAFQTRGTSSISTGRPCRSQTA
jgi:peptide/nickel transport system ATP-binding protein